MAAIPIFLKERLTIGHFYPNPGNGIVHYEVEEEHLGMEYQVHSVSGQLVEEGQITYQKSQLKNTLSRGVYYFSIKGSKELKTEKIIVL